MPPYPLAHFLLLLTLLTLTTPAAPAADDPTTALQRGLFEEEANQNLEAAVKAYQSVLAAHDEQRKLAATALFRLGECYRKLGRTNDAVVQYQRLLREYEDQTMLANLSRQNLVGLGATPAERPLTQFGADTSVEAEELARTERILTQLSGWQMPQWRRLLPTLVPDTEFDRINQQLTYWESALRMAPAGPDGGDETKLRAKVSYFTDQLVICYQNILEVLKRRSAELKMVLAQRATAPASAASRAMPADPRQRELLLEQIQIAEQQLAEAKKKVQVGVSDPEGPLPFERTLLHLKRELASLNEPAAGPQQRKLLQDEIQLQEQVVRSVRMKLDNGKEVPNSLLEAQRELLGLKRELIALDNAPAPVAAVPDSSTTAATDEEEKEVRRIQALIKDSPDLINGRDIETTLPPLHNAARLGQLVVARFLLSSGADVNLKATTDRSPALHIAASGGHKSMVELLLSRGADVNAVDKNGKTALHWAAQNGFKAVVDVLIASKADPNLPDKQRRRPLHAAVTKPNRNLVEALVASGAELNARDNNERTPLHSATETGQRDMVALLLAKGADVQPKDSNDQTPLHDAAYRGLSEIIPLLLNARADVNLKDKNGNTPLFLAALGNGPNYLPAAQALLAGGANPDGLKPDGLTPLLHVVRDNQARLDLARVLLEGKADPNLALGGGYTALHAITSDKSVSFEKRISFVELLLQHGANPNAQVSSKNRGEGLDGYTPLMVAVVEKLPEVAVRLLAGKADPNIPRADGTMPLHYALYHDSKPLVEALLQHGANVEVKDTQGDTPLAIAVARADKDIVELLLARKADVDARSADGLTPLHKAVGHDRRETFDLLLAAKADVNATDDRGRTPLDYVRENVRLGRTTGRTLPPRPLIAGSVPGVGGAVPPPLEPRQRELADALRARGAVDWAPRPNAITVTRRENGLSELVFERRGTNDFNRYTLFEAIAAKGWMPSSVPGRPIPAGSPAWFFPDFSKVNITRRDPQSGKIVTFAVDVAARIAAGDCAGDLPLEWGDLIDVPESEHKLGEEWPGLKPVFTDPIVKCLSRQITLIVKGQTNALTRKPQADVCGLSTPQEPSGYRYFSALPFRLSAVVQKSGLLLTSSDLSRVKVRRPDPATKERQEWTFDLRQTGNVFDLWLRDGDEIDVPEK